MPTIYEHVARQQAELSALTGRTTLQMGFMLGAVQRQAKAKLDDYTRLLADWHRDRPGANAADYARARHWLFQQQRYVDLIQQLDREIDRYIAVSIASTESAQRAAAIQSQGDMEAMTRTQLGGDRAAAGISFATLPEEAIEAMVGMTGNGTPLGDILQQRGIAMKVELDAEFVAATALGRHPRELAKRLDGMLTGHHWQHLRIARTEMLRAYREGSRMAMLANSDVVDGWVWMSAGDTNVCMSCLAQHGKEHRIEHVLPGQVPPGKGIDPGLRQALRTLEPPAAPQSPIAVPKRGVGSTPYQRALRKAEQANWRAKNETTTALGPNGETLLTVDGTESETPFTEANVNLLRGKPGSTIVHNHPGGWKAIGYTPTSHEAGMNLIRRYIEGIEPPPSPEWIGNSLSQHDIDLAGATRAAEIRATTPAYVYSMKPPPGYATWTPELFQNASRLGGSRSATGIVGSVYTEVEAEVRQEYVTAIRNGTMTVEQANSRHWHEVWSRVSTRTGVVYSRRNILDEWSD